MQTELSESTHFIFVNCVSYTACRADDVTDFGPA